MIGHIEQQCVALAGDGRHISYTILDGRHDTRHSPHSSTVLVQRFDELATESLQSNAFIEQQNVNGWQVRAEAAPPRTPLRRFHDTHGLFRGRENAEGGGRAMESGTLCYKGV